MTEFDPDGSGPDTARAVLNRLSSKQDGTAAAGSTANRKRMTFNNAMEYACERRILSGNPLRHVKWTRPNPGSGTDSVILTPRSRVAW
jgi:hypothetical protein